MLRKHLSPASHRRRSCWAAPRTGGARRKLLVGLVLLGIVIALLPMIIAKTPLLNVFVTAAVPSDAVHVTVGTASLGWLSSPALSSIQVSDSAGNALLTTDSIVLNRAPLNLVLNSRDLGIIQINRPQIFVKIRPDGSNLEDVLNRVLADFAKKVQPPTEQSQAATPTVYALQLTDGTIFAEDAATGRVWRIDGLTGQYDCHGAAGGLGNGTLAGQLSVAQANTAAQPAGRFAFTLKPNGNRHELSLQAEGLALTALEPYLRRTAAGAELSGTLSGNASAAWNADPAAVASDLTTAGTFTIDRLDATAPALNGDRIRLARVELPWRLTAQPNGIAIDDFQLRSDVGQFAARGRLDSATFSAPQNPSASSFPFAGNNDVELRGTVDLARLATMLPHALRIRSDTIVTAGSVELNGRLQPTATGQSLTGSLRTAQIAATASGKPFRWDDPIGANFFLRRENGTLALDALQCDSKFLHVQAAGTFQKLSADASFDLNALAEQLGQFIDLSGTQLAGTGTAQLNWQQTDSDKFSATATSDLTQLRVALSDGAIWSEPQLSLRGEAAGMLDPISHAPTRVDTAQLQVNGQGDQLDARLTGAVALNQSEPLWPVTVKSTGSIARWLTRARPWFAPGAWRVDGASEITATVRATRSTIDVTESRVAINNLQAASEGWNIVEPRVEFTGDAHLNRATGEFAATSAQLVTSTVSVAAKDVRYARGAQGIGQLGGAAAFRADLARIGNWRAPSAAATQYRPAGEFTGNLRFLQQSGRITANLTATGQNLVLTSYSSTPTPDTRHPTPSSAIWQEPNLTLRASANYDAATDRLNFDQLQVESNTLQATAAGQIDRLSTAAECNANGALNYDLAQLSPLLSPYLGEGIQLNGREQARFGLAGQLLDSSSLKVQPVGLNPQSEIRNPQSSTHWSKRVRAQFELPWSGASVYGLPVGPGKLAATLGDGAVQITPLNLSVGEGQLNLAPTVRFAPEPAELTLPAGPVITNVRISPQVSEAMLKYVAPVLAGATQSEGQFSLQLDGLRMPLADSKKTDSAGKLTVHSVRVTPGPTTQPFFNLAQQIESLIKRRDPAATREPAKLLSISDQQVSFRVVDGRAYHEAMEFQVGDVILRSQGSVGLADESLALNIQIPIQDAWVAKEPLLAGLKGQSLQVPVTGTLKRPQLDQRAVTSLTTQLLQNAAGQAVGNELNKALDKLFKPKQ
ncbi:MAG: DUF748 domain-containing protein [Pirellulales bacterium]